MPRGRGEEQCDEGWDLKTFSNNNHYINCDEYGVGKVTNFGQVGQVEKVFTPS